jgi:glutathione S-transferase
VCSVKARLALAEKGLDWESTILTLRGDQFEPEYVKLNPNAVVPTLIHDDRVIVESTVIMHYVDEIVPTPPLMPASPFDRAKARLMAKFIDDYVHNSCTALTFATANYARLAAMSEAQLEAVLAKTPDRRRSADRREVAAHGLGAPVVAEAIRNFDNLLSRIDEAVKNGPFIAGDVYSLADAAATPYVWRLDKLRLERMWDRRPGVAAWYDRIRERPSFEAAITRWFSPADIETYATFQPDPWPKVREVLGSV